MVKSPAVHAASSGEVQVGGVTVGQCLKLMEFPSRWQGAPARAYAPELPVQNDCVSPFWHVMVPTQLLPVQGHVHESFDPPLGAVTWLQRSLFEHGSAFCQARRDKRSSVYMVRRKHAYCGARTAASTVPLQASARRTTRPAASEPRRRDIAVMSRGTSTARAQRA